MNKYVQDISSKHRSLTVNPCSEVRDVVNNVDILITVTPSREPIVHAEWITPGMYIVAVGACAPYMQEHDPNVLKKANYVYADSIEKCTHDGEIHHALEQGIISKTDITGELGQLIQGQIPGRTNDNDITFVDLVGLGIQDATAAEYLLLKHIES